MEVRNIQAQIDRLYANELMLQPLKDRHSSPDAYNHFEIDYKNSKQLLFCLGDSYTKGCGLETAENIPKLLIKNRFGRLVSDHIVSDLINAGGGGYSNSWVFVNLEFMIDWINNSDYTNGYIVITFTENGRDIRTASHRMFDYIANYKDVPTDKLYNTVLSDIEDEWITRIKTIREKIDSRFKFIFGTHFVWHDKLFNETACIDGIYWIQDTWIELLAKSLSKPVPPRVSITDLTYIEPLNSILSLEDLTHYKEWIVNNADDCASVHNFFETTPEYFEPHDIGHPNAAGHLIWANAVIDKIKFIS